MKKICCILLTFCFLLCSISAYADLMEFDGEAYSIKIDDEAKLLGEEEVANVVDIMRQMSAYANVGFMTYPAGGSAQNSATKAAEWGNQQFGSDSRFTVFIIDMTNRHLDIYASKVLSGVLTSKALNSIADNVYRYATRGEYAECAVETFKLILNVIKDENTSGEFVFRGKIKWDMSIDEVTELEGEDYTKEEINRVTAVLYADVPVSQYTGRLAYIFSDDRLISCIYGILDPDEEMAAMMKKALTKVYGNEVDVSSQEVFEVASAMTGEDRSTDLIDEISFSKWVYPGGTKIYLIREENLLEVMYTSPEYLNILQETDREEVDVTGL